MPKLLLIILFCFILKCIFVYEKRKKNPIRCTKIFYIYLISFILSFVFLNSCFSVILYSIFIISTNGLLKFFIRTYLEDPINKTPHIVIGIISLLCILAIIILTYSSPSTFTNFDKWTISIPFIIVYSIFEVKLKNT